MKKGRRKKCTNQMNRSHQSSAPQACWMSPLSVGTSSYTGHLVLNQPSIQKAAVDTVSLGPWAPSIPQKHNELISVGTFETSWSAPAWLSTNPSQGPLSRPEASWPWWVPQTAFSCHLATWEAREGQSHQGRPQVSGKVEKATSTLMHRNQEVSK